MSDQTMTPEQAARVLARYPHTYITGHGADVFSELFRTARHYQERAEEREADMHIRIRQGYDKTVADTWRTHCAKVEQERDTARQQAAELLAEVARLEQECRDRADCEQSLTRMLLEVQEERDTATLMLEAVRHRAEQDGLQPILDVLDQRPMPSPVPGYIAVPALAIDPEAEARVDEWCAENEPKRTGRKL